MNSNEWDQRSSESVQEYTWFVGYLALGPGRSVSAYVTMLRDSVTRGDRRGQVKRARNRHVEEASMKHHWKERAGAYDLSLLQAELQTSGALVVAGIREYALMFLNALKTSAVKPACWDDVIKGVLTLAQLFPPETIAILLQARQNELGDIGIEASRLDAAA